LAKFDHQLPLYANMCFACLNIQEHLFKLKTDNILVLAEQIWGTNGE